MDGRTDGRTDGRMDGWMDGWMDGRTNGWTDGWMDVYFSPPCLAALCDTVKLPDTRATGHNDGTKDNFFYELVPIWT